MTFGTTLRKQRERQRMPQALLADLSGVTQPTISSWESDLTKPTIDDLKRLAKALEIPAATFFEENPAIKLVQNNKDSSQQNIQYQCVASVAHEELIATQRKLIASLETQLQQALAEIERLKLRRQ